MKFQKNQDKLKEYIKDINIYWTDNLFISIIEAFFELKNIDQAFKYFNLLMKNKIN